MPGVMMIKEIYFEDEEGNRYTEAYFGGYDVGDVILEGVTFRAYIKDNKLDVEPATKLDDEYLKTLNKQKWLNNAYVFAFGLDIFQKKKNSDIELVLMINGMRNYEYVEKEGAIPPRKGA
jgi:hypothetical protein